MSALPESQGPFSTGWPALDAWAAVGRSLRFDHPDQAHGYVSDRRRRGAGLTTAEVCALPLMNPLLVWPDLILMLRSAPLSDACEIRFTATGTLDLVITGPRERCQPGIELARLHVLDAQGLDAVRFAWLEAPNEIESLFTGMRSAIDAGLRWGDLPGCCSVGAVCRPSLVFEGDGSLVRGVCRSCVQWESLAPDPGYVVFLASDDGYRLSHSVHRAGVLSAARTAAPEVEVVDSLKHRDHRSATKSLRRMFRASALPGRSAVFDLSELDVERAKRAIRELREAEVRELRAFAQRVHSDPL